MTSAFFRKLCLATVALLPAGVQALYDGDLISIRGFGTLGAAWNSTDNAGFRRDVVQPDGPRGDLAWRTDSRLGLQVNTPTEPPLGATVQVLSRYDAEGTFEPEIAWGFLRYQPSEALTFRAGRLGWDVYLLADSREIGYSYPWVRPPVDFFGALQLYSYDGVDAAWSMPIGNGVFQTKLYAGEVPDRAIALNDAVQIDISIPRLAGFSAGYQTGNWQIRVGHSFAEVGLNLSGTLSLPPPAEGHPPVDFSLDNLPASSSDLGFSTAGIIHHRGPWELQLMYAYTNSSNKQSVPSFDSAYTSISYRTGKWMPYATYATTSTKGGNQSSRASGDLQQLLGDITGNSLAGQHTFSIGARYDFRENMALKFQVDRIHARNHMLWTDVDSDWDGQATVVSATLDFLF